MFVDMNVSGLIPGLQRSEQGPPVADQGRNNKKRVWPD